MSRARLQHTNAHVCLTRMLHVFGIQLQRHQMLVLGDSMAEFRDLFFTYYPYALAQAMLWSFFYLCPGSRHLYGIVFKRILYLDTVRVLTGANVMPTSVLELRARAFPEEAQEDTNAAAAVADADTLPPLLGHGPLVMGGAAAVSAAAAAAAAAGGGSSGGGSSGGGPGSCCGASTSSCGGGGGGGGGDPACDSCEGSSSGARRIRAVDGARNLSCIKTLRPEPLKTLMGDRSTLRFRAPQPEGLASLRPHQQRVAFDTSQVMWLGRARLVEL
jgi:Protein of unknown function